MIRPVINTPTVAVPWTRAQIETKIKELRARAVRLPEEWPQRRDFNDEIDLLVASILHKTHHP